MPLKLSYQATAIDNNKTLGDFLKKQNLSKKAVIALKHRGGKICVNETEKTTRHLISATDIVTVIFADEIVSRTLVPVKMEIKILYEDDFLLVVDKKAGLPVIPTGSHDIGLANGLLAYYQNIGLKSTVHFVNRLDKDTSGLMIIAKYRHIHHLMTAEKGLITRKYYALVTGILKDSIRIDQPIHRPSPTSVKRVVHPEGQKAITHVEVLQHFADKTLLICSLETGRTHQIRVHLNHIGCPISQDSLYGDGLPTDQQLLHSYFLEFKHPINGQNLTFSTVIPERFGIKGGFKNGSKM